MGIPGKILFMPYLPLHTNLPGVDLGLWQVEEEEIFFLTRLKLYENEWKRLSLISHNQKRLEWLSSRLCMKELLKISNTQRVEALNSHNGKPYLSDYSYRISFSHSNKYSAAIASRQSEVGIDLEYLLRKRNKETRFLFMNQVELDAFHARQSHELFLLMWSAKETIYKIFGERGTSFKDHIHLDISQLEEKPNGILPAIVHKNDLEKRYEIHYSISAEYLLTYTCDCL